MRRIILSFMLVFTLIATIHAARIKDIAVIAGVRENQLIGYGLVVGLDGTGDKTNLAPFTNQTFQNMLLEFGIRMPPNNKNAILRNVAAVAISAKFPPFAQIGQTLDLTISSLGNATSLRGGTLLMTPLRGVDGRVYAMAQGSVVVSGFGAQGQDGSKVIVNSTCAGSIPDGATVENTIDTPFVKHGTVLLELIKPDFTTAVRVEKAINQSLGRKIAHAFDARVIGIHIDQVHVMKDCECDDSPIERSRYVPLIARIENIELIPGEVSAKVIVNSRTGTIVIGSHVTISPVAISHGNLSVIITERPYVSQPNAFANGRTVKGSASDIKVTQQHNRTFLFDPGPSLNDLVEAVNSVGAAPGDLIAILEAIKAAGALNADMEVI